LHLKPITYSTQLRSRVTMIDRLATFKIQCMALLLVLVIPCPFAATFEGHLPSDSYFAAYVGKFCFDYSLDNETTVGHLEITMDSPKDWSGDLYFMIFDDENRHWKKARKTWLSTSCELKKNQSSFAQSMSNMQFPYTITISEHIVPRFWYFTFVACGIPPGLGMKYKIRTTNDLIGWQKEFSMDHTGLFVVFAVFSGLFFIVSLYAAWKTRWHRDLQAEEIREHPYIQLLMLSNLASLSSCNLMLFHYVLFMRNGFGSQRIRFIGVVGSIVANCTIFLVAMLASTGWAISTPIVPYRQFFLGIILLIGGISAYAELHAETTLTQSTHVYGYQSNLGCLALSLKILIFCWFAFQMKMTYSQELKLTHRKFYKILGVSTSFWALSLPITVLLAFLVAPHLRYKIVTTVELAARFAGQLLMNMVFLGPLSPALAENSYSATRNLLGSAA